MRVLLDEDLPIQLAEALAAHHEVQHVARLGWKGKSNGELLRDAVAAGYDVLATGDTHMPDQQDLEAHDLAVIQIRARRRTIAGLLPLVPQILATIHSARRRALTVISAD